MLPLVLALAPPAVEARPSDQFADSVGVALHLNYTDTPYGQFESRVVPALRELGVRHVRDGATYDPELVARFRRLARMGVRTTMLFQGDPKERVLKVARMMGPALEAVEGPNETDLPQFNFSYGGERFPEETRRYQRDLYGWIKGDPELRRLPVILTSMGWGKNAEQIGNLEPYADYGSGHWYTDQADAPGSALQSWHLRYSRVLAPNKPIWVTETGYSTARDAGHGTSLSDRAHGLYLPRLLLEHFRAGVVRTTLYELLDEWDQPKDQEQAHFGLVRFDGTRKPAFHTIRNLIALTGDRGPAFRPRPLPLGVEVAEDDPLVRWTLMGRRDGRYLLAAWRDAKNWDQKERRDSWDNGGAQVTLRLARPGRWRGYYPDLGLSTRHGAGRERPKCR